MPRSKSDILTINDPAHYNTAMNKLGCYNIWNQSLDSPEVKQFLSTPNEFVYKLVIIRCKGEVPPDLRHFPNMITLEITWTKATSLPLVAENCTNIMCENNCMTDVPFLPPCLRSLRIKENRLQKISATFPTTLAILNVSSNYLTELPQLPPRLRILKITDNRIERLPSPLPDTIETLYCGRNEIRELPDKLPASLVELHCSENEIRELPKPFGAICNTLEELNCSYNPIYEIDSIPIQLKTLTITNTHIRHFPEIPAGLLTVDCAVSWVIEVARLMQLIIINENQAAEEVYMPARDLVKFVKWRHMYHCIRLRDRFHRWLWKSREKKIMAAFHPDNLSTFLGDSEEYEMESRIEEFCRQSCFA